VRCYDYLVTDTTTQGIPRDLATVFLDRDGVLNRKMPEGQYVTSWSEFQILPGVPEAIARLNGAGFRVVVVSNQRGIALGLYSTADVAKIHANFQRELSAQGAHIDAFFLCPHDRDRCNCRKPLPGLFEQAKAQFSTIAAATSVMIGDSFVDMDFAHRLAMTAILIDDGLQPSRPGNDSAQELADFQFSSLSAAVDALLGHL
jgi:D-glycero-D-manno-heptose 1,7-bisphosphate phosphatase